MADAIITDDFTVNSTELGLVLGLSARRVRQMAQEGTILAAQKGRYKLVDSVRRYIGFVTGDQLSEDEQAVERKRRRAEADIKVAKAIIAKLEAEELKGKMHRSEDVEALTMDMANTLRSLLLGLPGRLAVDTNNAGSPAEASSIIRNAVNGIMEEMCKYHYDPDKYAERVRERRNWESQMGADADE